MPTLYWNNVSSVYWQDGGNWFEDDACTIPAANAPWVDGIDSTYLSWDLTSSSLASNTPTIGVAIGTSVSGICDISSVTNQSSINGGEFSGSNFTNNGGSIYGGIFTNVGFVNSGPIYGGDFSLVTGFVDQVGYNYYNGGTPPNEVITYATAYWAPAVSNNWSDSANWFLTPMGWIGTQYPGGSLPWTGGIDRDVAYVNNASGTVSLDINTDGGITSTCYLSIYISGTGTVNSGTFVVDGIINDGTINDGLFNVYGFSNNAGSVFGGTFTGYAYTNSSTIYSGTFNGDAFTNSIGYIYGGTFTGFGFSNNSGISDGVYTGANFHNYTGGLIQGGIFSGAGFANSGGNILAGIFTGDAVTFSITSERLNTTAAFGVGIEVLIPALNIFGAGML